MTERVGSPSDTAPSRVTAPAPSGDHRTRPRRRGQALDAAILEATIAEIAAFGYAELSMERVAERARASKASLYRRWPTRGELVMTAVRHLLPDPGPTSDTGSLRGDLLSLFRGAAALFAGPAGAAVRGLLSDALRDPAMARQLRSYTRGSSLATMRQIVARAAERAELPTGRLTTRQLEAGSAVLRFHLLTHESPLPDQVIVAIVDEVVLPLLRAASAPAED
ncbi:MAG: TetR/AcrR family transcriptional regulator [Pseudonocardia sp.]|nr:TetR/AcrR family transcriptional regulator [Pseudonocardia sp.]